MGCCPSLVQQVWQRLHIDINEDPNELIELKAIVKQYRSLLQSADRINAKVDSLPDSEKDRLHVEGGQLIRKIKDLRSELHELLEHRKSVIDRNPSVGGQDARADRLAEDGKLHTLEYYVSKATELNDMVDPLKGTTGHVVYTVNEVHKDYEHFGKYVELGQSWGRIDEFFGLFEKYSPLISLAGKVTAKL